MLNNLTKLTKILTKKDSATGFVSFQYSSTITTGTKIFS